MVGTRLVPSCGSGLRAGQPTRPGVNRAAFATAPCPGLPQLSTAIDTSGHRTMAARLLENRRGLEEVPIDWIRTDAALRLGSECDAVRDWRDTMTKSDCLKTVGLRAEGRPAETTKVGRSCPNR